MRCHRFVLPIFLITCGLSGAAGADQGESSSVGIALPKDDPAAVRNDHFNIERTLIDCLGWGDQKVPAYRLADIGWYLPEPKEPPDSQFNVAQPAAGNAAKLAAGEGDLPPSSPNATFGPLTGGSTATPAPAAEVAPDAVLTLQNPTRLARDLGTLSQRVAIQRIIYLERTTSAYKQMFWWHLGVTVVAGLTTLLIALKATFTQTNTWTTGLGIAALIFSAVNTGAAALESYLAPRENYLQNARASTALMAVHNAMVNYATLNLNHDRCQKLLGGQSDLTTDTFEVERRTWVQTLNGTYGAAQSPASTSAVAAVRPSTNPTNQNNQPSQAGTGKPPAGGDQLAGKPSSRPRQ